MLTVRVWVSVNNLAMTFQIHFGMLFKKKLKLFFVQTTTAKLRNQINWLLLFCFIFNFIQYVAKVSFVFNKCFLNKLL